jgi:hemerythrin-like domain-containing protein
MAETRHGGSRQRAQAAIRAEHRALGMIVQALSELLDRVAAGRAEADFGLFSAALYYIDEFPERVHHPKEDEHLFRAIRLRTSRFDAVLDELQAEHVRSAQSMALLHRALVRYQGGAPDGLAQFRSGVRAWSAMLEEHMRREEALLAEAGDSLAPDDWSEIAAAFAANEDPLLEDRRRGEFGALRARILNLLPRKMRLPQESA